MNERRHADWLALRAARPGIFASDAAAELGCTEAELVASADGAPGDVTSTPLAIDVPAFIARLPALGRVKAITRNRDAVLEVEGTYDQIAFFGPTGQSVSSVDLRIFSGRFRHAFAVREQTSRGERRSLQFFDPHGAAVHKLFAKPETDMAAFDALVAEHAAPGAEIAVSPAEAPKAPRPDAEIDVEALRGAWRSLRDTHDFYGMLRKFDVARTQALRLAGEELARPLATTVLEPLLRKAATTELPIMIFVGNPGVVQIWTGPVRRVVRARGWLNVLDPELDLHVRDTAVTEAWLVRKPTVDGIVTSVELYDAAGDQIALLVGKRKPGQAENREWRSLAEGLEALRR